MKLDEDDYKRGKKLTLKIRPMEIDDVAEVFHLGEKVFEAEKVPSLYRTWDEFEVIELFHGDPEFCLAAELGDQIVGFALGTTITKTHSAWKYGHLVWLGVDPTHQRAGVAEKLFNRFRDIMLEENVRMLLVDTMAENLPALHFFRKMGFGSPQQHIYLTLNLDARRQLRKDKMNGAAVNRRPRTNHA